MEENQMQGNNGGTATPNAPVDSAEELNNQQQTNGEEVQEEQTPTTSEEPAVSFTQKQVEELIKARVGRIYSHYGVKNSKELDEIVGKSKSYDVIKDQYGDLQVEHANLKQELSFIKNGIDEARYDDIKAYFKGKGIEFSNDALLAELETHPEWLKKVEQPTTLKTIGSVHQSKVHNETADEKMKRVFGI